MTRLKFHAMRTNRPRRWKRAGLICVSVLIAATNISVARAADAQKIAEFERDIRPLLVKHCIECHGPTKSESDLRLDSHDGVLKGGNTGPAVVPGRADESLVLRAVLHEDDLQMPPDEQLAKHEIDALARWIENGAFWPEGVMLAGSRPALRSGTITDEERAFWSLQLIRTSTVISSKGVFGETCTTASLCLS